MATIVTRSGKGSALTHVEMDANFNNLNSELATLDAETVEQDSATGAANLPVGTTAERPASPANGYVRYNTDLDTFEGYSESAWGAIGGGASGGTGDSVFYENDQTVSTNYTITSGKNAMSAGEITIADGVTVTVPDGSTWSIV